MTNPTVLLFQAASVGKLFPVPRRTSNWNLAVTIVGRYRPGIEFEILVASACDEATSRKEVTSLSEPERKPRPRRSPSSASP